MQPKSPKLMEDIRDAVAFIRMVTQGKSLNDYGTDRLLRQAVERNFEILGEAVSRLARFDAKTAERIGQYPQIIAFRNILIHGYDLVDHAEVWKIIQNDLPVLDQQVAQLISESAAGLG